MSSVPVRPLVAAVMVTSASVFPAFATGALGVQLRSELDFDERALGVAAGVFFVSAMFFTAALGRLGERLGPTRALRIGLAVTAAAELWLAATADTWGGLVPPLLIAGIANSMTQPTANLFLSRTFRAESMGMATAIKQSGMPAAALLGGLTVPGIALTVGWRWVYVAAAAYSILAAFVLPSTPHTTSVRLQAAKTDTSTRDLGKVALGLALAVFGASGVTAWIVSSAESSGMEPGPAALLLSAGSLLGIVVRLTAGRWADRTTVHPLAGVAVMLGIGAFGTALLALNTTWVHVLAIVPAFGAGWAWPGLSNLAVIRANPSAPGAATGITQTGIYIGNFAAPITLGVIINSWGYPAAWLTAAVATAIGSILIWNSQALQPRAN